MKQILIAIVLFLTMGAFAQAPVVKKVKIYAVNSSLRTRIPITIKDLKRYSDYRLISKDNDDFDNLFYDYKTCKELLTSQDTIPFPRYRPSWRGKDCRACVKLYFCIRTITIYFRVNGEYYFQGKYYKANKELYYCIFSFLEKDAIMPDELIEEGRIIYEQNRKKESEEANKKRQEFLEKQKQESK